MKASRRNVSLSSRFLRRFFIKQFLRREISTLKEQYSDKLRSPGLSSEERDDLQQEWIADAREYSEWLLEIESNELIRKAEKMDVYLDDLPEPEIDEDLEGNSIRSHFDRRPFGSQYLAPESKKALLKAMQKRAPDYRKERREAWDLKLKVLTALTGLIGTAIGLIALLKK